MAIVCNSLCSMPVSKTARGTCDTVDTSRFAAFDTWLGFFHNFSLERTRRISEGAYLIE